MDYCVTEQSTLRTIRPGQATGRLSGGNLSVLAGTVGTPFEIETAGRILFLEDVGERLYRLDRYLAQLWLAGKLQAAAGVLLGGFTHDAEPHEPAESADELLAEYFGRLDVPVLAGFPAVPAPSRKEAMVLPEVMAPRTSGSGPAVKKRLKLKSADSVSVKPSR